MKVYSPTGYSYVKVVEIPKTELKSIDFCHCKEPTETLKNFPYSVNNRTYDKKTWLNKLLNFFK